MGRLPGSFAQEWLAAVARDDSPKSGFPIWAAAVILLHGFVELHVGFERYAASATPDGTNS